jgi:hypothetical protein
MTGVITNPNPNISLPAQMVSITKKNKAWQEDCMDALEQIGTHQYLQHLSLIENYEMVKGKFIFKHYLEQDEYADMVHQLSKEFEIPNYLRHYDIISQVINTLSGEYQKRPDNFRVKGFDENTTNNYVREKTKMLLDYVTQQINAEIDAQLVQQGFDPNKQDFQSQEEQQSYEQQIGQARQALTPPEIERYMKYKWQDVAEIWGQHQLELDKQRFNLPEKERKEFEDMLIADRCFRHYYLTSNGYNQETWNPVNTFFHKSPEVDYVEDGDYVGRILYMTIADIIDRYGFIMKKKELANLEIEKTVVGSQAGRDGYGTPYGSIVPYENYPEGKLMQDAFGFNPANPIPTLGEESLADAAQHNPYFLQTRGYLKVTECYWKSQKKIGKVNYIDPQTGVAAKVLVDETFIVPEGFVEKDSTLFENDNEINTVIWTWVNEVWSGIKISSKGTNLSKDLYLNVKPMPFQFKGDNNPYFAKLPVCGQIFNNRNSQSMSLVDLMKPHQIGHNVAMNQLYQTMQREIGRFLIMDVNMLTNVKDWGGENSYEKFLLVAKSLGVTFVDTSPQNMKGANASNGMPKEVDLDESARMMSRMKIAEFFESRALSQVGITPQRLGNVAASETATGTQQAVAQSYAQTESYFTRFNEYKRRTLKMNLDIAQYVQSQELDVTVSYVKSDMSRAFVKLNGTDLMLADLHCYVSNSQEDVRQLETLRQLFMTNNNVGATPLDLAQVIMSNSPAEIKAHLEVATQHNEEKYQQQMQMEQQKIDVEKQIEQAKMEFEAEQNQLDRDNRKEVEYIKTFINQKDNMADKNGDAQPDILEYAKFASSIDDNHQKMQLERDKQRLKREEAVTKKEMQLKDLQFKQRELQTREKIEADKVKVAKLNKNKYDSKPSPKKKK